MTGKCAGFKVGRSRISAAVLILVILIGANSQPVYAVLQSTSSASKTVKKSVADTVTMPTAKTKRSTAQTSSKPSIKPSESSGKVIIASDASGGSGSDSSIIVSTVLS